MPSETLLEVSDGIKRVRLADDAARRLCEKVSEYGKLGLGFGAAENVCLGFFKRNAAMVEGFVHVFDGGNLLCGKTVAAHAFAVEPRRFGAVARCHKVGRYVFVYACGEGGHGVVADGNVSGKRGVVGEDGVVADHAVVREVAVRHNPVVVADTGFADAGYRA